MIQLIKFGDVFSHKEYEHVFLAGIGENIYTARILDKELTRDIENLSRTCSGGGDRAARVRSLNLLCYIILSTDEFKNRAACYGTGADSDLTFDFKCPLNEEDKRKLKEAIINDKEFVAPELIEEIKKMTI